MHWRRTVGWHPGQLSWRVAALFMVGSTCFAVGSFPPYAQNVAPEVVGGTFFVGSIFFTTAAASQLLLTRRDHGDDSDSHGLLVWACIVQLTGTVFFNLTTFEALRRGLDVQQTNRLVWAPDFFGSIAFLIASHLAWLAVCHRLWCVRRDDEDWWVAALNYVGSIWFMLSAIGQLTLPTTDEMVNITLVNLGTFIGAVCFFAGAYLLLPVAPRGAERAVTS